jgi:hypothetical protein
MPPFTRTGEPLARPHRPVMDHLCTSTSQDCVSSAWAA